MKITRNPKDIHQPVAPYVHQIEVTGPQRWLTLSGQIGMEKDGTIPEESTAQLKIALENIRKNLESANMEVQDLTKLVFYLDSAEYSHLYRWRDECDFFPIQ